MSAGRGPASLLLRGGNVVTLDARDRQVTAVAMDGDRIMAVGSDDELASTIGPTTEVLDLAGRTVVPGLIDAHTHLEITAYARCLWRDVRDLTVEEILAAVRELAAERGAGEWVVVQGTFGQPLPTRAQLDAVTPRNPAVARRSMHQCVANSLALRLSALDGSRVPPVGVRVGRRDGRLTGELEEGWDLLGWTPPSGQPLADAMVETALELYVAHGVTTLYEIAASRPGLSCYQDLARRRALPLRVRALITAPPGHQPLASVAELARVGWRTGFGDDWFAFQGAKVFMDGGRHGALRSSHLRGRGAAWELQTRTLNQLASEVMAATEAGIQVWIHSIGDLSQELALSALEAVAAITALDGLRHRVEHFGNELYPGDSLERLLALGAIPVPNPGFLFSEPDDPDQRIPPGVPKYAYRTLLDAGARPPGNSDTAGTQPFAANPWFGMDCMVRRRNRNGVAVSPEEGVSRLEALRAYTIDAAYAGHEEDVKGTLEAGKLADMAVLAADPLDPATDLASLTAELTIAGGRVVSRRASDR